MVQRGTVVNGVIVPDGSPPPDGTRVLFEKEEAFEYPHPLAPHDRDKEIALLRASIAQMDAGEEGSSVEDVFGEIYRQLASAHGRTATSSRPQPLQALSKSPNPGPMRP
jgi:hypothetical protein